MAHRLTVSVSDEMKAWLEEESNKSAIPQSTLITLALKNYIDQQKAFQFLELAKTLPATNIPSSDDIRPVLIEQFEKIGYSLSYDENNNPIVDKIEE